jgi:hypothetical protein
MPGQPRASNVPPAPQRRAGQANAPAGLEDDSEDPRRVAHEIVAQAHAVLFLATTNENLEHWCPQDLIDSVQESRGELWIALGELQAAIASGAYDEELRDRGIGGNLGAPKRKGLRLAVQRLQGALRRKLTPGIRRWLKNSAGWAKSALGSMSFIPGADVVGEGLDVVVSALDTLETSQATNDDQKSAS